MAGAKLGLSGVIGLLAMSVATSASGDVYRRGDATCSTSLTAADAVATIRALGGASTCDNDDCDRDGALTAADVDCASRCVFGGVCPVPEHAARVTMVTPESAPEVVPSSVIRLAVVSLEPPQASKGVTIGGRPAEIVDEGAGELLVALPPDLPPGPAELVVSIGEIAGAPITIEVAPPTPLGPPDTFDGTLALVDELIGKLLALDIESIVPDDPATVRTALTQYRVDLAAQRAELAGDSELTAADRLALDAAVDNSGSPEMLRAAIAEVEAAAAVVTAEGGPAAAPTGPYLAFQNGARTARIVAGVARTAGITISAPIVIAIGTGLAINAGAIAVASNPLHPLIFSATYSNAAGMGRAFPTAGGYITLKGAHFDEFFTTLEIRGRGVWEGRDPMNGADGSITYRLPDEVGTCGIVRFQLSHAETRFSSNVIVSRFQPEVVQLLREGGNPGDHFTAEVRGVNDCWESVFSFSGAAEDFSVLEFEGRHRVRAEVPPLIPGTYAVGAMVEGLRNSKLDDQLFSINNPLTGVTIFCPPQLDLGSLPTHCAITGLEGGTILPKPSQWVWTSNRPGRVSVESPTTRSTTELTARDVGKATIKVALESTKGPRQVLASSDGVEVEVVDHTPPEVSISSGSTSPVQPGASIPITVKASDNDRLAAVQLIVTGDAVANGSTQETLECTGDKSCSVDFTVALKASEFTQTTVTVQAAAFDRSARRSASAVLTFTIAKDDSCPTVTIQEPASGGTVNAGQTATVVAIAHDDGATDTGVKTFTYSATGPALTANVSQTLDFPTPLKAPSLRFNFSVKQPSELIGVDDKNVTISVAAADAAMPPNACPPQVITVGVVGVLDTCDGGITTDNPAGFIGEPFTITVALTGAGADEITRVTSVNPGGTFDLQPQGGGVYTVTLFYQGEGSFTLKFIAYDANGEQRCSGSIGLESLGPDPGEGFTAADAARAPAGASR